MAFLDHNGVSEFPFEKDKVFDAICSVIPTVQGMKIDYADKLQSRIMVKAGVSLWSWGENIPIQLIAIDSQKTRVQITSSPKTGIMFGGAFDMGKNRKNIENLLLATSRKLSSPANSSTNAITGQYQYNTPSSSWYEKTWLVILLCIIFFPVGLYALWKNSSIGKGWKIGITTVIALVFIANLGDDPNPAGESPSLSSKTEESTVLPVSKEWVEVYSFQGNGMKKSPVFELTGGEARLKYKYQEPNGIGMGMFAVYVVDEGDDIMKTGGFPEVMTQAESEESESSLQKGAGRYYLNVNASGNWVISIEERK